METYTVSVFGHRKIENSISVEAEMEKLVIALLQSKPYVEFLVGRNGDFDILAASVIRRCKRTVRSDNSALVWVLPYLTAELRNNEEDYRNYYDEIEICDESEAGHFKGAYQRRNRQMVDRSDLVVFCVQRENGGAWQTMKYAKDRGIPYLNINGGYI